MASMKPPTAAARRNTGDPAGNQRAARARRRRRPRQPHRGSAAAAAASSGRRCTACSCAWSARAWSAVTRRASASISAAPSTSLARPRATLQHPRHLRPGADADRRQDRGHRLSRRPRRHGRGRGRPAGRRGRDALDAARGRHAPAARRGRERRRHADDAGGGRSRGASSAPTAPLLTEHDVACAKLLKSLPKFRQRGYAVSHGYGTPALCGIGVPLCGSGNRPFGASQRHRPVAPDDHRSPPRRARHTTERTRPARQPLARRPALTPAAMFTSWTLGARHHLGLLLGFLGAHRDAP